MHAYELMTVAFPISAQKTVDLLSLSTDHIEYQASYDVLKKPSGQRE
jgi:hypothetical protein